MSYYCLKSVSELFLPKDGPPPNLLGAPVVGPETGFTPTPCFKTGIKGGPLEFSDSFDTIFDTISALFTSKKIFVF